jgi:hypothetical protein
MTIKKADVTKHALSRRPPHIRDAFNYPDWTAVCGLPFDRHQPVRQMNGQKAARSAQNLTRFCQTPDRVRKRFGAFSSEVDAGSREENASNQRLESRL